MVDEETNSVRCQCKSLTPTTIVNDINGLFKDSKMNEVFSSDGLSTFLDMNYWEFPVFYIMVFKTFIFLYCLFKGSSLDRRDALKISPFNQDEVIE